MGARPIYRSPRLCKVAITEQILLTRCRAMPIEAAGEVIELSHAELCAIIQITVHHVHTGQVLADFGDKYPLRSVAFITKDVAQRKRAGSFEGSDLRLKA